MATNAIHIGNGYYLVPLNPNGYGIGQRINKPNEKKEYEYQGYYYSLEDALIGYLRIIERDTVRNGEEATIAEIVGKLSEAWEKAVSEALRGIRKLKE